MEVTSVTSKGQVTIPKELRQQLGIRQGSRIEFSLVGNQVEMRVRSSPLGEARSGFGMLSRKCGFATFLDSRGGRAPQGGVLGALRSRRTAVPTDFDSAMLVKRVLKR